jgi:transcriptional regulator with GAF, ATPase, and Fis domain
MRNHNPKLTAEQDCPQESSPMDERRFVLETLRKNGWNIASAARSLRMKRSEFTRLLRQHGLRDVL